MLVSVHFLAMASSSKPESIGSSMSVQDLAKQPNLAIPQRYLRLDHEPSILSDGTSLPTIPVVDLKRLITGEAPDFELEKLHSMCKEWGIFQVVNHGVSPLVVEKVKCEIKEFYKLPLEEKMRYKILPGQVEGYGQTIVVEEDQKVDWADRFYMITNPVHRRKAHLLPQLPSSFRETLESFLSELQKLAMAIFGLVAKALKMDSREIEIFEDGIQSVRMTNYPPCPKPEMVMGITPHSDATGITILLQVNGVDGFQVKRDGTWIPVSFLPDAFVVNVGDILEIMSNGLYNSIEHRATVNSSQDRISIAMFFNPKNEAEVGPALTLLNPENPPSFKRVGVEDYFKELFSRKLNGKAFLQYMRIENGEGNAT